MEKLFITKFGEVNQIVWNIEGLTDEEKRELIDKVGQTILEAMEQSHRDTRESILKIYK
jgi:hypothetical protein|tara:strand:+ start:643 stop:819 length:177 start_codon:yes stop_codon:yes gene_type:complete